MTPSDRKRPTSTKKIGSVNAKKNSAMGNSAETLEKGPGQGDFGDALESVGVVVRARRGQRIAIDAGTASTVFALKSGILALASNDVGERRQILALFYAGDVFSGAVAPQLPGLTLVAQTDCVLLRIKPAALPSDSPARETLRDALLESASQISARSNLHLARLSGLSTEMRVAAFLLELALRTGRQVDDTITCEIPLTRGDIADYLLLNADTLSRIMTRLRSQGMLATIGRSRAIVKSLRDNYQELPVYSATMALHGGGRAA